MTEQSQFSGPTIHRDHGSLPDWTTGDLPEPLSFNIRNIFRTIGPGAILLAGSIGGGEWIVGPLTTVRYGPGILWIATVGILLQMVLNLESIRYTLYSGEPVVSGIMRLNPGSKFWGLAYIILGTAQLATPAMALGCANVLFTVGNGELPAAGNADRFELRTIALFVLALTAALLLSGKSIERLLEKLSWAMVVFIFAFLIVANVLFVPASIWAQTAQGFLVPQALPANLDILLVGVFAATAGSGGLGNLAVSNWTRDKGLGMGRWMGSIGGALAADDHQHASPIGRVFLPTSDNLRRWGIWWKYALLDQSALWALGCVLGMYLYVNLALAIVPADSIPADNAAGAFQARFMADQLWHGFWYLALFNGFWILFSTQLGNTDVLTRVVTDTLFAGWPRLRTIRSSQLYLRLLMIFMVWGVVAIMVSESAVSMFKILGLLASPILAISAIQILHVNTRFLPSEIRPRLWRRAALVCRAVFYGAIAVASAVSTIQSLLRPEKPADVQPAAGDGASDVVRPRG